VWLELVVHVIVKKNVYMQEVVMPAMLVMASAFSQIRVAARAS
jgi:hypothetical protein